MVIGLLCYNDILGPSVRFLTSCASKYHIYIGFSFLEADGGEFYNSFVLAAPDGSVAGKYITISR
jgi:N-carbamoylputrescine amidase